MRVSKLSVVEARYALLTLDPTSASSPELGGGGLCLMCVQKNGETK
jgi:hypothetical protein